MERSKRKNKAPILPFDITFGESMIMYDKMPYVRNLALCSEDMIKKESGNVIKFFRCNFNNPHLVGGDNPVNLA